MPFNLVDLAAFALIGVAAYFGWRSGLAVQALALLGFLAGLAALVLVAPHVVELLAEFDPLVRTMIVLTAVAAVLLVGQGLGNSLGVAIRRRLGRGILGGLDQGAGAVFGFARGLFLVWLLGGLLGVLPLPTLAAEARQSAVLRALDTRLPSPVVLAAELGRLAESAGLPDVLVGAPPPIEAPADGPSGAEAEAIAAPALASTVRIEAAACGNFTTGSGFAVTSEHFVTNAHVVAGSDRVWLSFDGSLDRFSGAVVHFDPELDVAVVAVEGLEAPPLELAAERPERGDPAVALGYTGGGRLRIIPAVVSRSIDAIGRDIYGQSIVTRNVIELRADVSPGDSGGPVMLADGTVGGVTFSESRDDQTIGYALSPTAVARSIEVALERSAPVATGRCISPN